MPLEHHPEGKEFKIEELAFVVSEFEGQAGLIPFEDGHLPVIATSIFGHVQTNDMAAQLIFTLDAAEAFGAALIEIAAAMREKHGIKESE